MSPTHPGIMTTMPPMRALSTGGPRVPLRGGPMGRGDYGKFS